MASPCLLCATVVKDNDTAIFCDSCNSWTHIKCNKLNYVDYKCTKSTSIP